MITSIKALTDAFGIVFSELVGIELLYLPVVCLSIASVVLIFRKFIGH